jgi:hypothetical protein
VSTLDRMLAMMRTAQLAGRRPKRWIISERAELRIKREEEERWGWGVTHYPHISAIYGIPATVDDQAVASWGLVVE